MVFQAVWLLVAAVGLMGVQAEEGCTLSGSMAFCESKEAACQLTTKVLTIVIKGEQGAMPCTLDVPLKWSDHWAESESTSPELHEIEDEAMFSIFSAQQPDGENNNAEPTTMLPEAPVEEEGSGDSFVFVPVTTFEASSGTSTEDEVFYDAPTNWPTDLSNLTAVRPIDEGNGTDAAMPIVNRKKRAGLVDEVIIGWIGLAIGLSSLLAALGALVYSRIRAQPSCASRAAPSVQLSRCCSQPSVDAIPMVSLSESNPSSRSPSIAPGEPEGAAVVSANSAASSDQPLAPEVETSFTSAPAVADSETMVNFPGASVTYEDETTPKAPVKPARRHPVRRSATLGARSRMFQRMAQFEPIHLDDDAHL